MKDALLYIAEGAKREGRGVWRDAKLMERSMAGLGTKDERLVWRCVFLLTCVVMVYGG